MHERHFPPRFYIREENKTPSDGYLLQVLRQEDMNDINQPEFRWRLVGASLPDTNIVELQASFKLS